MQVLIPHHAVWEPNAAFATDFHIRLRRPRETGSVQISITSQDDYGSDIPLNVPPRVRVTWHPRNFAGVQRIKKTWEESEVKAANTLPRNVNPQSPSTQRKSSSLPRYQQPVYLGIEKMLQERTVSPRNQDHSNQTEGSRYGDKRMPEQDKRWNVVTSPTYNNQAPSDMKVSSDEELPQWAKGLGDQYDYDDVVVVWGNPRRLLFKVLCVPFLKKRRENRANPSGVTKERLTLTTMCECFISETSRESSVLPLYLQTAKHIFLHGILF